MEAGSTDEASASRKASGAASATRLGRPAPGRSVATGGACDTATADSPAAVDQPRRTRWALTILGRPAVLAAPSAGTRTDPSAGLSAAGDVGLGVADGGSVNAGVGMGVASGAVDGVAVEVTGRLSPRMVELLVFLAVHPDGVRRDAVVAALWPDTGRHRPANNLSALLNRLRTALAHQAFARARRAAPVGTSAATAVRGSRADIVAVDGDRYRLDPEQVTVDYWRFLAATAPRPDPARPGPTRRGTRRAGRGGAEAVTVDAATLAALRTAHELYRGPLADGLAAEWVLSVRESARRSYLDATARLVRHYAATSPTVALQLLETARNLDPTNENLYRDIMALQLRAGDKHAAANTLRLLQTQLADIDEVVGEPVAELARNIHDADRE